MLPPSRGLQSITKIGRHSLGAGVPGGFLRKNSIFGDIKWLFSRFYDFFLKFLSLFPPCTRGKLQFPCTFPSWEAAGELKDRPPTQNLTTNLPQGPYRAHLCANFGKKPTRPDTPPGTPTVPPGPQKLFWRSMAPSGGREAHSHPWGVQASCMGPV